MKEVACCGCNQQDHLFMAVAGSVMTIVSITVLIIVAIHAQGRHAVDAPVLWLIFFIIIGIVGCCGLCSLSNQQVERFGVTGGEQRVVAAGQPVQGQARIQHVVVVGSPSPPPPST